MIAPAATRLPARLGETASELLRRLPPHATAFVFHLNLTDTRRTPQRRGAFSRALRARGIRIVNEHVTDISKRRVQAACAAAGLNSVQAPRAGDPRELLIVKTNANYGGEKERFLGPRERRALGFEPRCRWIRSHDGYLILPRRDVRPELWRTRELVVERFIENRYHVFYRAHKLLDRVIISRMVNPARIKKMLQQIPRTNWYLRLPELESMRGPTPPPRHVVRAVAGVCRVLRLDLGSIDLVEDDAGECYVIDVNASPYWGEAGYDHMLRFLGDGLLPAVRPAGRATCAAG